MEAVAAFDSFIEMRRNRRYSLRSPVRFVYASHTGSLQNGEGSTRDISGFGIYVLSSSLPSVGALIQLEVLLPNLEDIAPGLRLCGEGKVLRCDIRDDKATWTPAGGFAASVQFYTKGSDLKLSNFEMSGQIVESKTHEQARTVRRISFGKQGLVRRMKYLSFRSLSPQCLPAQCVALDLCL
jgi:hypothetical protein